MARHKSSGGGGGGKAKAIHAKVIHPKEPRQHAPGKPPKAIAGKHAAKYDMQASISPTVGKGPGGSKRKGSR